MLPTREWRNELRPISPPPAVGVQRNRKPRIGRPDTVWHKLELNKKRESVIEEWLAMRTARSLSMGNEAPGSPNLTATMASSAASETAYSLDHSEHSLSRSSSVTRSRSRSPRAKVGARRKEVPRFYDSIADYLVRLEAISKVSKYQAHVDKLREIREEASKPLISDRSRELANRKRLRKAVELFQLMDIHHAGKIVLDDVDDEMLNRLASELDRAFVLAIFLPFAQAFSAEHPGATGKCVMALEQFVEIAMEKMQSPAEPKPALTRERSVSSASQLEMSFHPEVSETSQQIVRARRSSVSHEQLITKWIEEKAAWEKKRELKAQELVKESLSECTFKPQIRSTTPSSTTRLMGPSRKQIRGEAALTSEEREFRAHCTFSPRVTRDRERSLTPGRGRVQTM